MRRSPPPRSSGRPRGPDALPVFIRQGGPPGPWVTDKDEVPGSSPDKHPHKRCRQNEAEHLTIDPRLIRARCADQSDTGCGWDRGGEAVERYCLYGLPSAAAPATQGQTHNQQKRPVGWFLRIGSWLMAAAIGASKSALERWGLGTCVGTCRPAATPAPASPGSPPSWGCGTGCPSADSAAAAGPPRDPPGAPHHRGARGRRVWASGATGGVAGASGRATCGVGLRGPGRLPARTAGRAGLVGPADAGRAWGRPPVAGGGAEPAGAATLTVV
jgi:hypothetical protein